MDHAAKYIQPITALIMVKGIECTTLIVKLGRLIKKLKVDNNYNKIAP